MFSSTETEEQMELFIDDPLVSRLPVVTETEIVCGDCSGDSYWPQVTTMTRDGACATCGGRSYILASKVGLDERQAMQCAELREIYRLACNAGLIRRGEGSAGLDRYRRWLLARFGVENPRDLVPEQRAQAMNRLRLRSTYPQGPDL